MSLKKHSNLIVIVSLILINIALYFNGINNDFIWDDTDIIKENHNIRNVGNLKKLLTMEDKTAGSTGYFRPLINVTYLFDYQLFKDKAYGFRLTNIAFNIACVIALFFLALLITQNRLLSFATAVIFLAQAVHVEAVTFISGRNNVVCAFFIFLSLYYYIKSGGMGLLRSRTVAHNDVTPTCHYEERRASGSSDVTISSCSARYLIYSMVFLFLGAMSKEFAYMLPFIFILCDYSFDPDFSVKKRIKSYIAAFFTLGTFMIYRVLSVPLYGAITLDSDTLYKRVINSFFFFASYIRSQILPNRLNSYYNFPLLDSFFSPRILLPFLFLLALTFSVIWFRHRDKIIFFSFFTHLLLLMPVSNIVTHPGAPMADRWLYPASAFFALFLCRLIFLLFGNKKAIVSPITMVSVLFLSIFTVQRNGVFKNNFLFYSEVLREFPNSVLIRANLGLEYKKIGNIEEAERQYLLAIKSNPKYHLSYNNLGVIYEERNEIKKALALYKKAYELNPNYALTAFNLGASYKELGNIEESNKYYNIAISLNPNDFEACYNLGNSYRELGNIEESNKYYNIVISLNPDFFEAYYNLIKNYYEQKEYEKALEMLKRAEKITTTEENKKEIKDNIKMVADIINKQNSPQQQ